MSEIEDKRRRIDLDLFVLALIDSGIATPYELQRSAGLSQGATVPALQRLLEGSFLRQGKPGPRGRVAYQTTAAGRKLLKTGRQSLIEDPPSGDLDADLRVALLAIWGGDHKLAAEFLHRSADKKRSLLKPEKSEAKSPLARWYSNLRSSSAELMIQSQVEAMHALADALPRKLSSKPKAITVTRVKRKQA